MLETESSSPEEREPGSSMNEPYQQPSWEEVQQTLASIDAKNTTNPVTSKLNYLRRILKQDLQEGIGPGSKPYHNAFWFDGKKATWREKIQYEIEYLESELPDDVITQADLEAKKQDWLKEFQVNRPGFAGDSKL